MDILSLGSEKVTRGVIAKTYQRTEKGSVCREQKRGQSVILALFESTPIKLAY